jgi:hypothetical protein
MKSIVRGAMALGLFALILSAGPEGVAREWPKAGGGSSTPGARRTATLLDLSLRFEPNRGQFGDPVRYLARGASYGLYLTPEGATLSLLGATRHAYDDAVAAREEPPPSPVGIVSMHLAGGRQDVEPVGLDVMDGESNYFVGGDRSRWRTHVEAYARVRYPQVLPGVDVVYYGTGRGHFEYDLEFAPGTDPRFATVAFHGVESIEIDAHGAARLRLSGGAEIDQPAPIAYQVDAEGRRAMVDVRFERRPAGLGFVVGAFDPTRTLVIDPTLLYSTYLGGSLADQVNAIAVDAAGEVFVTGITGSSNFPTASPLQAANNASNAEAFVTKFNATGSALVYSTYLGGSSGNYGNAIAVDGAGEAFVAGETYSPDFPTVSPFQASLGAPGAINSFVAKLNAAGSALMYSTYLGGSSRDFLAAMAIDSAGEVFVVGHTYSSDYPLASPFQATFHGAGDGGTIEPDAFLTKLNATGTALVYSTYLGGSSLEYANGVAVDSAGEAFVVGGTSSTDFPTASPLQATLSGTEDAFVTKFNVAGSALMYSTYLGGSDFDIGSAIALDSAGEAFVGGTTQSTNFPTVSPFQAAFGGGAQDAYISKFNATGSALVYSTYLGGSSNDVSAAIAVDSLGEAVVVGHTASTNFPTALAIQPAFGGDSSPVDVGGGDAFVTMLTARGSGVVYSTYLGGSLDDTAATIAVDRFRNAFVAGLTKSPDFPMASPFQATYGGGQDAFVTAIPVPSAPAPATGRYAYLLAAALLASGAAMARRRKPARS